MIPKDTVAKILDAAEIIDVVSDFVALKKRGANYLGLCPFHNEKGPSFTVSPAKGIFKCFGCGKSGTPVNFIMEHEGLSYPEALRFLARKYHIKIEEIEQTADEIKEQNAKESMMLLSAYAQQQFTKNLLETEEGKRIALSYFKERGFSVSTIERFQLGYSLENRKAFSDQALKDGYLIEYLVKTGLTIEKEGRYFDRFAARVIFPILNISGRPIAFGGRILTNDKKLAKYLNSPESEIYHKSNVLYGLYQAKKSIVEQNNCYLVEGYTDVISLSQAGIENVVASAGTSLTVDQIRLIRRFTSLITVMYDGDAAGIKASFRGINLILAEGLQVKVLLFPNGEDPDSFSRKHSSDHIQTFLQEQVTDFISFKTKLLLDESKNDPIAKAQLIHEIIESISQIPDVIARSLYIKECSRLMQVEEQMLIQVLNKALWKQKSKDLKESEGHTDVAAFEPIVTLQNSQDQKYLELDLMEQEAEIIRLLLNYGNHEVDYKEESEGQEVNFIRMHLASFICGHLSQNGIEMENQSFATIYNTYFQKMEEFGTIPDIQEFISHDNEEIRNAVTEALVEPYQLSPNWKSRFKITPREKDTDLLKVAETAIDRLKQKHVIKHIHSLYEKIKTCTDEHKLEDLMIDLKKYQESKDHFFRETGTIISH